MQSNLSSFVRWRGVLCCLMLPVLLAACQTPAPATAAAPPVNLSGYPPAFREGYADGCNSAHGKPQQDTKRMKSDSLYAQGYRDGFDSCGRR